MLPLLAASALALRAPVLPGRARSTLAPRRAWPVVMNEQTTPTKPIASETNAEVEDGSSGLRQLLGFKLSLIHI